MDEYLALLNTPWTNEEVAQAFIFSCYTGLRWVDVKLLNWNDIKGNTSNTHYSRENRQTKDVGREKEVINISVFEIGHLVRWPF